MMKVLIENYKLPREVKFCKKCTVSNQRPRISFEKDSVCSVYNYYKFKRTQIDCNSLEAEPIALCDKHRKGNYEYEVIVPCSGGKDGSFVAHQHKYKFGMNPLAVNWAPLKVSKISRQNLDAFIVSGFNHVLGTPNLQVTKKLTHLSFYILR
jgi:hypothetical protein